MLVRSLSLRTGAAVVPVIPPIVAPDDLAVGPVFWIDADAEAGADNDSITPTDRGSLAVSLTGTVTLKTGILNGRRVLRFNGSSQFLTAGAVANWPYLHNGDGHTLFVVFKTRLADPNALYVLLDTSGVTGANTGFSYYYDDRTSISREDKIVALAGASGAATNTFVLTAVSADDAQPGGEWAMASFVHNEESPYPTDAELFRNGAQVAAAVATSATSDATPSAGNPAYTLHIGRRASASTLYFDGDIAEIISFDYILTMDDHYEMLRYLENKWGVSIEAIPAAPRKLEDNASYDAFPLALQDSSGLVSILARRGTTHFDDGVVREWTTANGGDTWSSSEVISDATYDVRSGGGGVTPTGAEIYMASRFTGGASGTFVDMRVYRKPSAGSWSDLGAVTFLTGNRFNAHGPMRVMPSGKLAQTVYEHQNENPWKSFVVFSDDDGLTWGDRVDINDSSVSGIDAGETTIAQVGEAATDAASTWIAVARVDNGTALRQFKSTDGMQTWTDQGSVPNGSGSNDQDVAPYLYTLEDGRFLLAWGDRVTSNIEYMTGIAANVAASPSNWGSARSVFPDGSPGSDFGYPAVFSYDGTDEEVHIVFYTGGTSDTDLAVVPADPFA